MFELAPKLWIPKINKDNIKIIIIIFAIISFWVYLSGIGGFTFQNLDHQYRNSIFNLLVEEKWPIVIYEPKGYFSSPVAFIYYIGFWLPAAGFGKIFGLQAGYYMQVIWAILGIALFYYLVSSVSKKIAIWPLVIFIFFSGLDIVGRYFFTPDVVITTTRHIEYWGVLEYAAENFPYSSITTQLFWAFNQALPSWVICMLIYIQKNNKSMIFILALSMLSSTFPFVGLIPFVLMYIFSRNYDQANNIKEKFTYWFKDTFTFVNIVGGGIIGIISFLYLKGNNSGQDFDFNWNYFNSTKGFLMIWIMSIILEVFVYCAAIYKYQKDNKLFYMIIICSSLIPFLKVGYACDFSLRASIPALVFLYLLVVTTIWEAKKKRDYMVLIPIIILLLVGSVTPIHEINRTITGTVALERAHVQIDAGTLDLLNSGGIDNFWGKHENNFFFKYLAKDSK